jgi:hypothetical protein
MLLRPAYLSQKLDRPLPIKGGGTLRTIRDACNYMTGMGKRRELRDHWQRVCKLILTKEGVLTVSRGPARWPSPFKILLSLQVIGHISTA